MLMASNWTGDDRPHALHGLFPGTWMVRTRDQTLRTTQSGSRVFLLPLLPERLRGSEGTVAGSLPTQRINVLMRLCPTGISRTGWHPSFVPAATEHGTDGSLHRTRRPSRTHRPHALSFHRNADTPPRSTRTTRPDPIRSDPTHPLTSPSTPTPS